MATTAELPKLDRLDKDTVSTIREIYTIERLRSLITERSHGNIDPEWLFDLLQQHGAVIAGSSVLSAYVGDKDESIDDIDIFVTKVDDYDEMTRTVIEQMHQARRANFARDFPAAVVAPLRRFCPLLPPTTKFHPLEDVLWSQYCHLEPNIDVEHYSFGGWNYDPVLATAVFHNVWSQCTLPSPANQPHRQCKHSTHLTSERTGESPCHTFVFEQLKLSVVTVMLGDSRDIYEWIRQHFDIVACASVIFDGRKLYVSHAPLLNRKWTWLRPHHSTDASHGPLVKKIMQQSYDPFCTIQTSGIRLKKYLQRGWQFVDPKKLEQGKPTKDSLIKLV